MWITELRSCQGRKRERGWEGRKKERKEEREGEGGRERKEEEVYNNKMKKIMGRSSTLEADRLKNQKT